MRGDGEVSKRTQTLEAPATCLQTRTTRTMRRGIQYMRDEMEGRDHTLYPRDHTRLGL